MTKDCSECKHFDEFHTSRACHKCKPWLASTDCVSRADAIEVVHRHFTDALDDLPTETDEDGYVIYKDTKSVNELLKHNKAISKELKTLPSTDAVQWWSNYEVACILAELFGDDCACNYNGIDEWLPLVCDLKDSCPNTVGVACWEQFLKHYGESEVEE